MRRKLREDLEKIIAGSPALSKLLKIDQKKVKGGWWYTECPICANLDKTHGKCNCTLFKPDADSNGICKHFTDEQG